MAVNLPRPNMKEQESLKGMQSYLYQLVEQLQFALNTIEAAEDKSVPEHTIALSRVVTNAPAVMSLSDDQATFQAIKPYIIKSADIVNAYYEEISRRLEGDYEAISDFGTFKQHTEATFTETSERITASSLY